MNKKKRSLLLLLAALLAAFFWLDGGHFLSLDYLQRSQSALAQQEPSRTTQPVAPQTADERAKLQRTLEKNLPAAEAQALVLKHPALVRKLILTGTGPAGGKGIDKVAGVTFYDILRATLTRNDPKEFLFFNRDDTGRRAARAFVGRLGERTQDRDKAVAVPVLLRQLKAIKTWGRSTPADLSRISQPTLIANGDHDRMVPSVLSEDLHRRIAGSQLVIYPNAGHGGIFQYHDEFTPTAIEFLDRA